MTNKDGRQKQQQERNRLTLAVFTATCGGFLLAMVFGALPLPSMTESHEWVAVTIAAVAAAISGYAVYLVAQTLNATRDTLKATQKMAEDQNRIGEIQTRPWVLYMGVKTDSRDGIFVMNFRFKNYGTTPAKLLIIKTNIAGRTLTHDTQRGTEEIITYRLGPKITELGYMAPSEEFDCEVKILLGEIRESQEHLVNIKWSYHNYHSTIIDDKNSATITLHQTIFGSWHIKS